MNELHEWRESYAAQFDFDLDKMFADLKSKEAMNPTPRAQVRPLDPKPPNPV
ncbi:MAG: hypothetical protein NTW28_16740 [Candidatus Solibacter sp.]|nr:hypothetical protein [Candidatus Solibacter sp.]